MWLRMLSRIDPTSFIPTAPKVKRIQDQQKMNPFAPEIVQYKKVLETSHAAAFQELWGLSPSKAEGAWNWAEAFLFQDPI